MQTEDIETEDKGVQAPGDLYSGRTGGTRAGETGVSTDTAGLMRFLRRTAGVIEAIFDENAADAVAERVRVVARSSPLADAVMPLPTDAPVPGFGRVSAVEFSETQPHLLGVVYQRSSDESGLSGEDEGEELDAASVVAIWNLHDSDAPLRTCSSPSRVTSLALSPRRSHLAVGGTDDGMIVVWDLRERKTRLAPPAFVSYATDAAFRHTAPVLRVAVFGGSGGRRGSSHDRVVSVDASGLIVTWSVTEGSGGAGQRNGPADTTSTMGAHANLGQRVDGRISLQPTTQAMVGGGVGGRQALLDLPREVTCVAVGGRVGDDAHTRLLCGTGEGQVVAGHRLGGRVAPSAYDGAPSGTAVTGLAVGTGACSARVAGREL